MGATAIQWCDFTFNPWRGCAKVAPGCKHCYAEKNRAVVAHGTKWGTEAQGGTRTVAADSTWRQPLAWNRQAEQGIAVFTKPDGDLLTMSVRPRVFCGSLMDVFEEWPGPMVDKDGQTIEAFKLQGWERDLSQPFRHYGLTTEAVTMQECRNRLFALIDATPNLDWLLLTKRPENIRRMWPDPPMRNRHVEDLHRQNVWLGCSVATQEDAEKNITELMKCRELCPVLFLSGEPLIEAVDLTTTCINRSQEVYGIGGPYHWQGDAGIDWCIIGGESGPNARPCHVRWVRKLMDQCAAVKVPVFIKQLGSNAQCHAGDGGWPVPLRRLNGGPFAQPQFKAPKGGDPDEWPEGLRVREFPGGGA